MSQSTAANAPHDAAAPAGDPQRPPVAAPETRGPATGAGSGAAPQGPPSAAGALPPAVRRLRYVGLFFWGLLFVTMAGLYAARMYQRSHPEPTHTVEVELPGPELMHLVPPFELVERNGQPFRSESLAGKVWVASFFFTNCPAACLRLNSAIAQVQEELAGQDVTFVSITVDPKTDTPEVLAQYAARYTVDPQRWLFLTGPMDEIARVANEGFQLAVAQVTHSDRMVVVDGEGRIRGSFRGTDPTQVVLLKKRLAELAKEAS